MKNAFANNGESRQRRSKFYLRAQGSCASVDSMGALGSLRNICALESLCKMFRNLFVFFMTQRLFNSLIDTNWIYFMQNILRGSLIIICIKHLTINHFPLLFRWCGGGSDKANLRKCWERFLRVLASWLIEWRLPEAKMEEKSLENFMRSEERLKYQNNFGV